MVLSLRELEALAGAFLSVLLAFLDAGIAGNQARLFQRRSQVAVVFNQGPRDPVTNSAGLASGATAGNVYQHVKLVRRLSQLQRLANNHSQSLVGKILIEGFP